MKIAIADIQIGERRRESECHWQAKNDIERLLISHGFQCQTEYPVETAKCVRRVDIGILSYQIAVEIWTVPTRPNASHIKERADELRRVGWKVANVDARSWDSTLTLWYIGQLASLQVECLRKAREVLSDAGGIQ